MFELQVKMSEAEDHEPEADQDMNQNMEGHEGGEGQEPPEYPLVFQCNTCHVIVGDTTAWESTLEDVRYFILSSMCS